MGNDDDWGEEEDWGNDQNDNSNKTSKVCSSRGDTGRPKKRIRLRPVVTAAGNVKQKQNKYRNFRYLSVSEAVMAGFILLFQLMSLYSSYTKGEELRKLSVFVWPSLISFSISSILTWLVEKNTRSRALSGAALGFQILSAFVAVAFAIYATLIFAQVKKFEVFSTIICTLMFVANVAGVFIAICTSIKLCGVGCCDSSKGRREFVGGVFEMEELENCK